MYSYTFHITGENTFTEVRATAIHLLFALMTDAVKSGKTYHITPNR